MRATQLAFAAAWLVLCVVTGWLLVDDRLQAVEALGVPVMEQRFADVRPITGAAVALAQGLDPLVVNPGDPWGRALNYPRVWLLPAMLGVGPEHSDALAIVLLLTFAAGLLLLLPLADSRGRTTMLVLCMCSPVTWLAIERANNDILVFTLLAAAAWALARRPRTGTVLLGTAAMLKLYPIFALGGLLGLPARRARRLAPAFAAAFVGYLLWMRADLAAIHRNSLAWNRISYGITQLPDALAANTGWSPGALLGGAVAAVAGAAVSALLARRRVCLPATDGHALHAFRIGAGVFVGTFCLGSNFDYRLLCLLLAVPQVVRWCQTSRGPARGAACLAATLIPLLLWSMTWRKGFASVLGSQTPGLMLDELLTWTLLLLLLVALCLSLPGWLLPGPDRANSLTLPAATEPAAPRSA